MNDILKNKLSWMEFAHDHNATTCPSPTQLSGSQSYTLVAIHLAANIPIPKSVQLDIKRAQGKFIADHFRGLRNLYESGIQSGRWLPAILEKCREFANENSLNYDELVLKMLEIIEIENKSKRRDVQAGTHSKNGIHSKKALPEIPLLPESSIIDLYDDDDIKI